jgi:hypothetical protein
LCSCQPRTLYFGSFLVMSFAYFPLSKWQPNHDRFPVKAIAMIIGQHRQRTETYVLTLWLPADRLTTQELEYGGSEVSWSLTCVALSL